MTEVFIFPDSDDFLKVMDELYEYYCQEKGDGIMSENKDCGYCKHLQIDGMFGMWCDMNRDWTSVIRCPDFEEE